MRDPCLLPKRLYLEITGRCNLACPFCRRSARPIEDLPLTLIEKVMKESRDITDYLYLHVQGEPLLHPQFEQVLRLADEYERKIQLVTNGLLLAEYQDRLLASCCLRKISISLQGLFLASDLDNKLRALEGFIAEARNKDLIIELRVWSTENPEITDYIKTKFGSAIKNGKIRENLYLSCKREFRWPDLSLPLNTERSYCPGPKLMICILSDGTITPCCLDAAGYIALGNIREQTLSDALLSERYLAMLAGFRDNKAVEKLCQHCYYLNSYEET